MVTSLAGPERQSPSKQNEKKVSMRHAAILKASGGKDSQEKKGLVEEEQLLERQEINRLADTLDAYASLLNRAPALNEDLNASRSLRATTRGLWQDPPGAPGEPHILRPVFCRFLLASRLCGVGTSLVDYHTCVQEFDDYAVPYGATTAMSVSHTRQVMAGILYNQEVPAATLPKRKGKNATLDSELTREMTRSLTQIGIKDGKSMKARAGQRGVMPAMVADDSVDQRHMDHGMLMSGKPLHGKMFFMVGIPLARAHIQGRSRRLEQSAAAKPVHDNYQSEADDSVWPPLPPRFISEQELPAYLQGVREWEQELGKLSAVRVHQLKAHTEGVLRGELLASQLLEPEVLHCATRFKPLFRKLFMAYVDWPNLEVNVEEDDLDEGLQEEQLELGHMSFVAFFRFCVDFELFPRHVSFEEIRQIHDDAEAVLKIAKPRPPPVLIPVVPQAPEKEFSPSPKSEKSEKGGGITRKKLNRLEDPGEGASRRQSRQHGGLGMRSSSNVSLFSYTEEKRGGKELQSSVARKAQTHCDRAAAAAAAALEAAVPKADFSFMEKPVGSMSNLEVRSLCFFAAVDEWLSERYIRMPDLISPNPNDDEGDNLSCTSCVNMQELQQQTVKAYEKEEVVDKHNMRRPSEFLRHQRTLAIVAQCAASAVDKIRPIVCVSPQMLLQAVAPMGPDGLPSEEELGKMYKLVLHGPDAAVAQGAVVPPMSVFQLDKVMRKAREARDQARRNSSYLLWLDAEFPPAVEDLSPEQAIDTDEVAKSRAGEVQQACIWFLEALDKQLLAQANLDCGPEESLIAEGEELTPEELLEKAERAGVDPDVCPLSEELSSMFVDISGNHKVTRKSLYIAIAMVQESRRLQRKADMKGRLTCLGGNDSKRHSKPKRHIFGLAAFIECLLKLAFFSLGCKGTSEIQRRAPAWWKCAWLLTMLSGRFSERVRHHQHKQFALRLALEASTRPVPALSPRFSSRPSCRSPSSSADDQPGTSSDNEDDALAKKLAQRRHQGKLSAAISQSRRASVALMPGCTTLRNADRASRTKLPDLVNAWLLRMCAPELPRYTSPIDKLAAAEPLLFHPSHAEANVAESAQVEDGDLPWPPVACPQCSEQRSPSGWGTPGCTLCSGLQEHCLPLRRHVFGALLRIEPQDMMNVSEEATTAPEAANVSDDGSEDEASENDRDSASILSASEVSTHARQSP